MYDLPDNLVWLTWISVLLYLGPGTAVGIFMVFRQWQETHQWGKAPHVSGYITSSTIPNEVGQFVKFK